ncbi:hypothetical protein OIU84_001556 [Salix udensis]|uniref:Uncharacterized protein n=1 Tax=Salix udensis TaxID=889485 RepID=A0AAD6K7R0_9ROSI|nr:hypothetical protein OIU84_001556 [Salix udensis]
MQGVTSSKNDGFSLTSGDFPTLGSEKESSGKNIESQDCGSYSHPGSSSGGVAPVMESTGNSAGNASIKTNAKIEPANSYRRENPMYGEDGLRPNMEKWHPDPHLFHLLLLPTPSKVLHQDLDQEDHIQRMEICSDPICTMPIFAQACHLGMAFILDQSLMRTTMVLL